MTTQKIKLDWIDALKAFAILGILLNHAVESYHIYPWFSNPSADWPSFTERLHNIFPQDGSVLVRLIQFIGWLGDMGPGIFIFVSGFTLTLSALNKKFNTIDFYKTRALRIYPLYVSIHLIILIVAILFFKWGKYLLLWSPLSILGLRFTNSLFWFLNPSWWFIWLIIQMYFVFPFLLALLNKKGTNKFLVITLAITLLSRAAGVLGLTLSADMDKWMTGLFGGTRLFEFTFGMYIGYLIHSKNTRLDKILKDRIKLPLISVLIYITGFIASWTYVGSIFSSILITVGLSGIFYSTYVFTIKGRATLEIPVLWIGKNSFSTFLIHQPFMIFFGALLAGYTKSIVLTLIIIASFISGHFIENWVNKAFPYLHQWYNLTITWLKGKIGIIITSLFIFGFALLSFFILIGKVESSRIISLSFLILVTYLVFYRIIVRPKLKHSAFRYLDTTLIISSGILLFRGQWFSLFNILILFSYFILMILKNVSHKYAMIIVVAVTISGIGAVEYYLNKFNPVEINSWGELPALQINTETVYSLVPNKLTHLKYNNYNYLVKTNSLGFNSPEINFTNKTPGEVRIMIIGDAFSMPEGMEYKFSYPALLEKKFEHQFPEKRIHVVNAGVTGYGPNEEYAQLKKYIDIINPDIVINQLFINEFLEINTSREERLADIGLIKKNRKINFSKKLKTIGNTQFSRQTTLIFKNLTGTNEKFNYEKSLLFLYEKNSPLYSDSVIYKMNNYLLKMASLCKENKSDLIVLGVPGQIEVSSPRYISYFPKNINLNDTSRFDLNLPMQIFRELCDKNNIKYLNSKDVLRSFPEQPLYFSESWHWNKKGHCVIADFIFEHLKTSKKFNILYNMKN